MPYQQKTSVVISTLVVLCFPEWKQNRKFPHFFGLECVISGLVFLLLIENFSSTYLAMLASSGCFNSPEKLNEIFLLMLCFSVPAEIRLYCCGRCNRETKGILSIPQVAIRGSSHSFVRGGKRGRGMGRLTYKDFYTGCHFLQCVENIVVSLNIHSFFHGHLTSLLVSL